jgi:hypothetical protein
MGLRGKGLAAVLALAWSGAGCGDLTIRTWVQVIEAESSGSVLVSGFSSVPFDITRLQGGFLGVVRVNTSTLPAPMQGTIVLEDIRLAGNAGALLGNLCSWGNPAGSSDGTVTLDLFGGQSGADVVLDLKTTTSFSEMLDIPPTTIVQPASFALGSGLSLQSFAAAAETGSIDGLFATRTLFVGDSILLGQPVTFTLDLAVTNRATPPAFSADQLAFCAPFFDEQGRDIYYGVNAKSSYLRAQLGENPPQPLKIPLADLGVGAGDRLRLSRVGTFSDVLALKDGTDGVLTGIFSSSTQVIAANQRYRVPGAREAGNNINTAPYWECLIWPLCWQVPTDVSQDFRIDPTVTVTVPSGAAYLIVAPLPPSYIWNDDAGFGFGLTVEVNPPS